MERKIFWIIYIAIIAIYAVTMFCLSKKKEIKSDNFRSFAKAFSSRLSEKTMRIISTAFVFAVLFVYVFVTFYFGEAAIESNQQLQVFLRYCPAVIFSLIFASDIFRMLVYRVGRQK